MKKIVAILMGLVFALGSVSYVGAQAPASAPKGDEKKAMTEEKKAEDKKERTDKKAGRTEKKSERKAKKAEDKKMEEKGAAPAEKK